MDYWDHHPADQVSLAMFAYLCLGTNDMDRAIRFYDPVMGALGHRRCVVLDDCVARGSLAAG